MVSLPFFAVAAVAAVGDAVGNDDSSGDREESGFVVVSTAVA